MFVDLVKTLSLVMVSSLLQTFYFCFCIFSILVHGRNQYALGSQWIHPQVVQKVPQTFIHIFAKYLLIIKMFSPANSVKENLP